MVILESFSFIYLKTLKIIILQSIFFLFKLTIIEKLFFSLSLSLSLFLFATIATSFLKHITMH